ncbi:MAG: hypothetical protein ACTSPI_03525 [Candidatus Heimdallarchaeaceae archaeon]
MPTLPWQVILLSPLGLTLSGLCFLLFIFLYMLIMRTPAMTFFKAGFGKKMILINPDEDKRIVFRIANKDSDMAYVKKKGYYIIDPAHVHMESSSKIPCAITYSSFSESIDPTGGEYAEKLKDMGINNYVELIQKYYDEIPAEEMLKSGRITKEQYDEAPNKTYTFPKKEHPKLKIMGKSVSFDRIVQYFSKNTRADLIESKIQHRISAIKLEKMGADTSKVFKWAVILGVLMICGALAYTMIAMQRPEPVQQVAPAVTGIIGQGVEAISGTGLT